MTNNLNIGERIKRIRGRLSPQVCAARVGVSRSAWYQWEDKGADQSLKHENAVAIARMAGITVDELLNPDEKLFLAALEKAEAVKLVIQHEASKKMRAQTGAVSELSSIAAKQAARDYAISTEEFVTVRMYHNALGAGGVLLEDYDRIAGEHAYRREWIEKNGFQVESLAVLPVSGDSMIPYVFNGNKVLVNMADKRIVDGEHYAIRVGDKLKIKRLFTQGDGKIRVESYNAATDYITPDDDAEVIGLVVDRKGSSYSRH